MCLTLYSLLAKSLIASYGSLCKPLLNPVANLVPVDANVAVKEVDDCVIVVTLLNEYPASITISKRYNLI